MLVLTRRKDRYISIDGGKIEIFFIKKKNRFYIDCGKDIKIDTKDIRESRSFRDFEVKNEDDKIQSINE